MQRLLQGEVGSGKTIVAFLALLLARENGFQGAFLAPTEILARQHFARGPRFFRRLPGGPAHRTADPAEKRGVQARLARGE